MKYPKELGMTVLAVWLILHGLQSASLFKLSFAFSSDLSALLAIAAGVLLLMKR